jgi:hypothetical protein
MPKPAFLSSAFGYYQETGIKDVANVISRVGTLLTGMTIPWTSPSADRYVSHMATSGSRFIDFAMTKIDALTLQVQAYNMAGTASGQRRMYITAAGAGSTMRYFYGQYHCVILCVETGELWCMFLLDNSPFDQSVGTMGSFVNYGSRDNVGAAGYGNWYSWCYRYPPETGATFALGTAAWSPTIGTSTPTDVTDVCGNNVFMPVNVAQAGTSQYPWHGRLHQALIGPDALADHSVQTVPLGDGTTGDFYVLAGRTAGYGCKMLVRKA